ncbi:hypothetical protein PF595_07225 [Lactobacillus delbrueckii]|nr:hypothetical protein [Lactobacillus delbrueckii]MDA3849197.1 hypothetical protein [Lactobacillus delbrueckii]
MLKRRIYHRIEFFSLQTVSYSQNLPGQHGLALALVEAGSIADVQGVMRAARRFHLPVCFPEPLHQHRCWR